ncbi:SPW repeat protein [Natrinema sp. 74]|uniref:SPW repeat protein n=1 Tax=Natrinema sp. 74 TaxID=3384159 RepID=UPI0038D49A65
MSEYDGTDNPDTPWREDGTSEEDNRGDEAMTGRDRIAFEPNPGERGKRRSAAVGLLGLALLAAAVVFDPVASQFWNDVLIGVTLVTAGAYNYDRRSNAELGSLGVAILVALLGLWLVASPFLFGEDAGVGAATGLGFWTEIIAGLLALGLGTDSAVRIRSRRRDASVRDTAV